MSRQLTRAEMAAPGTPQHTRMVTASKVPAILGIDPYKTTGELWMEMSGLVEPEAPDEQKAEMFAFGHDAEHALAASWKRHNPGWQLNAGEIAYTDDTLYFPNQATIDRRARRGSRKHILEFKATASHNKWGGLGDEIPADVAVQHTFQKGISGIHDGTVVVLAGYDMPLIPRFYTVDWDEDVYWGLVDVCHAFYKSLGESEPPMPPADLMEALAAQREVIDLDGEMEVDPGDLDLMEIYSLDRMITDMQNERQKHVDALISRADGKHLVLDGKKITKKTTGRFSQARVPDEAKHLLKHPDVQKYSLDQAALKARFPEVYAAATGDDSITIPTLKE